MMSILFSRSNQAIKDGSAFSPGISFLLAGSGKQEAEEVGMEPTSAY
jgi:hypothetical protein